MFTKHESAQKKENLEPIKFTQISATSDYVFGLAEDGYIYQYDPQYRAWSRLKKPDPNNFS